MMYNQVSPQISQELLLLREQLELFQLSSDVSDKDTRCQDGDWDYAVENIKTNYELRITNYEFNWKGI